MERYEKQIILPEIGIDGQTRLGRARVLIVGMGGLGCPVSSYLAAAGIGFLRLLDHDNIDRSNLQRQILYQDSDIGKRKVELAAIRLSSLNPEIELDAVCEKLSSDNVARLTDKIDLIIDASDNFETRLLTNRVSVEKNLPLIQASLYRFEGQVITFRGGGGPCYRCLFPEQPPAANCSTAGVIGALAGIIGSLQAMEAIRYFTNFGDPFGGLLLRYDGLKHRWSRLKIKPDFACNTCHGIAKPKAQENRRAVEIQVTPSELKARLDAKEEIFLLDVREPEERNFVNIGGHFIPLGDLPNRLHELDPEKEIIIYCHHGVRSLHALGFLRNQGFTKLRNLQGGIDRYSLQADPSVPRY